MKEAIYGFPSQHPCTRAQLVHRHYPLGGDHHIIATICINGRIVQCRLKYIRTHTKRDWENKIENRPTGMQPRIKINCSALWYIVCAHYTSWFIPCFILCYRILCGYGGTYAIQYTLCNIHIWCALHCYVCAHESVCHPCKARSIMYLLSREMQCERAPHIRVYCTNNTPFADSKTFYSAETNKWDKSMGKNQQQQQPFQHFH